MFELDKVLLASAQITAENPPFPLALPTAVGLTSSDGKARRDPKFLEAVRSVDDRNAKVLGGLRHQVGVLDRCGALGASRKLAEHLARHWGALDGKVASARRTGPANGQDVAGHNPLGRGVDRSDRGVTTPTGGPETNLSSRIPKTNPRQVTTR